MRALVLFVVLAGVVVLAACSGVESRTALGEPLRIQSASFKAGKIPAGAGGKSEITSIETPSTVIHSRQSGKAISGRTSPDAVAVALAFADLGTGYWVFPAGGPDPANGGELDWTAVLDFGADLPAGKHELNVVAIDAAGRGGAPRILSLCVDSDTPDNLAACIPTAPKPAVVVALTWDAPADLDLVVAAPDNSLIRGKRPIGGNDAGVLDRDSNAACVLDRIQREDLVFQNAPPAGSYLIYANLFSACGTTSVHFQVAITREGTVTDTHEGTLLAVNANGGSAIGTFVTELDFQ